MKFDGTIKNNILAVVIALGLSLFINQIVLAQSSIPLPNITNYGTVVQNPGNVTSFESGFASLAVGIVMNLRYVLTALSVAVLIYSGFRMVISQGQEDVWKNAKTSITYAILGLALVGLSGELVRIFAVGQCLELSMIPSANNVACVEGGFLKNPNAIVQRAGIFNSTIGYMITFVKYLIGGVCVLFLLRNAIRMVSNTGGEELNKDKKNILASVIGLFLIIVADPIINNVLFKIDKTRYPTATGVEVGIDYKQGITEIIGFTNFLVSILTPIAILVIVVAGVMYMTAAGNPENQGKAKKMIQLALVGLLIIYGAFAIVSTFISGQFSGNATTNPAAAIESSGPSTNQ